MTQTYAQFAPTSMDPQGLGLDDRQDWLVGPCSQTRDSGPLDRSNFRSMCAIVDDAGLESEVHRFGHWGPGWFEVLLVAPSDAARACLDRIADRLDGYPVLDEDDHSREESEDTDQTWEACYRRDVERAIEHACGVDDIDDVPIGDLRGTFERALRHVGGEWVQESGGMSCYRSQEACKALADAIGKRYHARPADPRAGLRWVARFRKVTR